MIIRSRQFGRLISIMAAAGIAASVLLPLIGCSSDKPDAVDPKIAPTTTIEKNAAIDGNSSLTQDQKDKLKKENAEREAAYKAQSDAYTAAGMKPQPPGGNPNSPATSPPMPTGK